MPYDSAKKDDPMGDKAKPSLLRSFFAGLRKKRIVEILAAFIAGGWLIIEVVDRLLVGHYHFPKETIDITVVTDEYFPFFPANGFAHASETKEALDWIEQAISWGFSNHRFLSRYNRFLAPLRGDPRFEALMERAREKERRFEV